MQKFYFTFGVKYDGKKPNGVHPFGGHKDGHFLVEAVDESTARTKMTELMRGPQWAMCYSERTFAAAQHHFPKLLRHFIVDEKGNLDERFIP